MAAKTPEVEKRGFTMGKAILKLSMYVNSGMLTVSVLKARHLYSKFNCVCQPFVQVSLEPDVSGGTKCFTSVTDDAPHPVYNEKFSFEMLLPSDGKRRLHISVWNSSCPGNKPEFLGAMSFGLQHMLSKQKDHSGWFYLLRHEVGRRKHLPAILRSSVYEDVGALTCTENTPLIARKELAKPSMNQEHQLTTDVVVNGDFNADDPQSKPSDTVDHVESLYQTRKDLTIPEINTKPACTSPKQVRFDITRFNRSTTDSLKEGAYSKLFSSGRDKTSASQNPFIIHYRKEIFAATNAGKLKQQELKQQPEKVAFDTNDKVKDHTDADDEPNTINEEKVLMDNLPAETVEGATTKPCLAYPSRLREDKPSEIWVDCKRTEAEQDSGICDSLTPSPKSSNPCCCRRRYDHHRVTGGDSSVTSEDRSDGNHAPVMPLLPKGQNLQPSSSPMLERFRQQTCQSGKKCEQLFNNGVYSGDLGLPECGVDREFSELSMTNNFDECENCLSNYYGVERHRRGGSFRKSRQSGNQAHGHSQPSHTKVYFL